MSHIFISYSSKDRPFSKKLVRIFEKKGWDVWWDKDDLKPGTAFDRALGKALDAAFCIVVLWSPDAVNSSWVLDEAFEGRERQILVPALIRATPRLPFGYRRIQYIDISKWKGNIKDLAIQGLMEQIAALQPVVSRSSSKIKKNSRAPKASATYVPKKAIPKKAKPVTFKRNLSGALDGKTIVFTGTLSESRKAHAEKVKTVGARYVNTVSRKTNYLVAGKKPGAKKLAAAKESGVTKISEKQWLKILNEAYRRTLAGKNVVFTGKLSEPRAQQEKLAVDLGANVAKTISAKTDYLIVGEKAGKVKLEAAEKQGLKIINEQVWQEIVASL